MKKTLLISILTFGFAFIANSQCLVNHTPGTNVVNTPTGFLWGQGFTATCNGDLNYVQFTSDGLGTMNATTLNIYNGNNVTTTPIYTQAVPSITISNVGDPIRIVISGSVPMVNGNQYTFEFQCNNIDILADFSGTYPGGDAFQDGVAITAVDVTFEANITTVTNIYELNASDYRIFPNPVSNILTIETNNQIEEVMIYNLNGSLVKYFNQINNTINVEDLTKGMYLISIKTDQGIIRNRFIKN